MGGILFLENVQFLSFSLTPPHTLFLGLRLISGDCKMQTAFFFLFIVIGDDTERRDFEQHLLMCGCIDSKHHSSPAVPVSFDHDASVLHVTVRGGSGPCSNDGKKLLFGKPES